jgi:Tfp pilus assembly protein PilN
MMAACAAAALLVSLSALLGVWHVKLQSQYRAALSQRQALEKRWVLASGQLEEVEMARSRIEAGLERLKRLKRDQSAPKWAASALQSLTTLIDPHVELDSFHAFQAPEEPQECELRIEGFAAGSEPRLTLDRVRQALDRDLRWRFGQGAVHTDFERLEDESAAGASSGVSGRTRAAFTIRARVSRPETSLVVGEQP